MAKFEMDTEFVRKLAEILEETHLGEIELADGERRIRVARPTVTVAAAAAPVSMAAPLPTPAASPAGPAAGGDLAKHPGAVKSPMVGTAYLAPEPGKPNFIAVGDKVVVELREWESRHSNPEGEIIEVPKAGTVTQILVENAQPVEFGEPLAIVE